MKRNQTIIATTFAILLIGGLEMNPAAAVAPSNNWSDLTTVTNAGARNPEATQIGHTSTEFRIDDLSAVTHRSVPVGTKPMVKEASKNYSRNDITAITHHYH